MMDEKFFAWLDGELNGAEAAEMAARVARDPELAKAAEEHRAFAAQLRDAFDPVTEAPVPERIRGAVRPSDRIADISDWRERKQQPSRKALPQWMSLAATLAVGVIAGTMVSRGPAPHPVELKGGQMIAAASLETALDQQLASHAQSEVRIGLTFRDRAGNICRSFTTQGSSGLACHEGEDWRVKGLFAPSEGQDSAYRMASAADPALAALIENSIAGEPFDQAQETQAKEKSWR